MSLGPQATNVVWEHMNNFSNYRLKFIFEK